MIMSCPKCAGDHEAGSSHFDCLRHWKLRAVQAENTVSVEKHYGGILGAELRQWLKSQAINGDTIGSIRRQCFMPWESSWNALVRDETASLEKPTTLIAEARGILRRSGVVYPGGSAATLVASEYGRLHEILDELEKLP